ncbi:hypothetical protein [uncultured Nonlabens sp.]|uniref:hypothetical protein n=1 Tax=uncultured Nonlabens sp. TaxID=859306 RepID=UPI0026373F48|nr:hypothetical protein [uncultured Nonlabens sp.]
MKKLKKWLFTAQGEKAKVAKCIFFGSVAALITLLSTGQTVFYKTEKSVYTEIFWIGHSHLSDSYSRNYAMKLNYDEFLVILIFIIISTLSYSIIKKN